MKNRSKLSREQQQGEQHTAAHESRQHHQEFATAEDLLRFDAAQTDVPPQVAEKLKQSIGDVAPPRRSWWKNLFGR